MSFNSIEYLVFLPIVFLIYWGLKNYRWQNLFIVFASYFFYGVWNPKFLFLIAFTTLCSYISGIIIHKSKKEYIRKALCTMNILVNLGILFTYKYFNFFADSFARLMDDLGMYVDDITLTLILPVGISFYTFQALSYTIDVYRRNINATCDIVAFFSFISFFPQLVAGPIERATSLLPQFLKKREFDYTKSVDGLRQILWGLFKKMVVADNCAVAVNIIFDGWNGYNGSTLLIGGILFSFQIYGDFSGYSDIAIGTAKLFGIHLMKNFDYPYFSRNVAEFWKRWHISLNTWFVDYVYIPLGGSREGKYKHIRNTIIIFLLSGLWHGANWTYVVWGLYHGLWFIPLLLMGKHKINGRIVAENNKLPSAKELLQICSTFIIALFGWIIFRASDISTATSYIGKIFSPSLFNGVDHGIGNAKTCFIYIALLIIFEWFNRTKEHCFEIQEWTNSKTLRYVAYYAITIGILWVAGSSTSFIYFQF